MTPMEAGLFDYMAPAHRRTPARSVHLAGPDQPLPREDHSDLPTPARRIFCECILFFPFLSPSGRRAEKGGVGQSGRPLGYETLRMRDARCGACQEA